MNKLERQVLRQIGKDVSCPNVFADNAAGLALEGKRAAESVMCITAIEVR